MSKISNITNGGSANDTSLCGYLPAPYAALADLLGEPGEGDGYKVSTEWVVTFKGKTFTLYDYKVTSQYEGSDAPTVEEFRAWPTFEWHVGAHTEKAAQEFIAVMSDAVATWRARLPACVEAMLPKPVKPVGILAECRHDGTAFYRYEPGNGTRYDVVMVDCAIAHGALSRRMVAITIINHNRGCAVPSESGVSVEYLAEKLRMSEGDAKPLLALMEYFKRGA